MWRKEIRLAGSGGQGLGFAAMVLADASLAHGLYASFMQSHGPEARGGASRADLTISDQPIPSPWFAQPQMLLVLSQKAWDKFGGHLGPAAIALIDQDFVAAPPHEHVLRLPFERTARGEMREKVVTNMVALGALAVLIGRVPREAVEEAAERRAPRGFGPVNRAAVVRGWELMSALQDGMANVHAVRS